MTTATWSGAPSTTTSATMGRSPSFKVVRGAADALAKEWCYRQPNVTLISVPVNWGDLSHPDALICTRADGSKYDANAGIRSCAEMLDEEPDFVLAFPGNKGARDMLPRRRRQKERHADRKSKRSVGRTSLPRRDSQPLSPGTIWLSARVGRRRVRALGWCPSLPARVGARQSRLGTLKSLRGWLL